MPLGNNDFFGLDSLFGADTSNFFTTTDTKSVLGKNVVLNFLGKIEFEIRNLGYSDTANEIADFYEKCKKDTCGIIGFFTNPVIKMILNEIQNMPTIRVYLKNRIFDEIEVDKVKSLDNIFKNNDEILEKQKTERTKFLKDKELYKKRINKIMYKHNCSFKEAEQIYKKEQEQKAIKEINKELDKGLSDFLGLGFSSPKDNTNYEIKISEDKPIQITLDDDYSDDIEISDNNDNFWTL